MSSYHCWLIISEVLRHSLGGIITASAQATILYNEFEIILLRTTATSPKRQWCKCYSYCFRPVSQSSGNWGHQPQDQEDGFYGHYSPRKAEANFVPRNNERGSYAGSGQPGMDPRESYASSRPDSYSDRGREWYQDSPLQRSMSGPVYNTQPKWGESLQPFDQNPRESTRSLHIDVQDRNEWHQPRDRSSGSLHSPRLQAKHAAQTQSSPTERNPIYENLSADLSPGSPKPQRPPLPAAYRQQIAHELAETKTPKTKEFMLTAAEMEQKRRSDPHYFQYPESPEQVCVNKIPTLLVLKPE